MRCVSGPALIASVLPPDGLRSANVAGEEPTGKLYGETTETVISLMLDLNQRIGTSLVIAARDSERPRPADRIVRLQEGKLQPEASNSMA